MWYCETSRGITSLNTLRHTVTCQFQGSGVKFEMKLFCIAALPFTTCTGVKLLREWKQALN